MKLNIDFIRSQYPSLSGDWTYFDNAGGSQTVRQVGTRINEYLYNTNVQLGASYDIFQNLILIPSFSMFTHGPMLASWSQLVTITSSPGLNV